jgi:peptide/nickel transport system ATP-binding protein
MNQTPPLLEVSHLSVEYTSGTFIKKRFRAVDDVSLTVAAGECLGVVGESGSGKSTIGRSILGLAPVSAGTITLDGADITHATRAHRRRLSRDIQVIFQDPYSSLSPAMSVEDILSEPLVAHGRSPRDARARVRGLLDRVHLPHDAANRLPREFSGGQRQRIAIARALALEPRLIICDEPVSALDLITQARVLDLLVEIQRDTDVAYVFISHDLTVVRHISHRVMVLKSGQIVETGAGEIVTSAPVHPYTRKLLMSSPLPDPRRQAERRNELLRLSEAEARLLDSAAN